MADKHIVITSINNPTKGVKQFSEQKGYKVVVIGDKKTPDQWSLKGVNYISAKAQTQLKFSIIDRLPYNHYSRKMIGYLLSIKEGSTLIYDTDDDNIPYSDWAYPEFDNEYDCLEEDMGFVNIYELFTSQKIWPRGLPLELISKDFDLKSNLNKKSCNVGIWQGLADNDPDVDAIYRLTSNQPCWFDKRAPVVLPKGTMCPFNTQNTLIRKELFPLLYLPSSVTFRFTDILRSLVAQPIMWLYGYQLGFTKATVLQDRNEHDIMVDFKSEVPMFLNVNHVIDIVKAKISSSAGIYSNLMLAYEALYDHEIVSKQELDVLDSWIIDLKKLETRKI